MDPQYAPPWRHYMFPAHWSPRRRRLHNAAQKVKATVWWIVYYLNKGL